MESIKTTNFSFQTESHPHSIICFYLCYAAPRRADSMNESMVQSNVNTIFTNSFLMLRVAESDNSSRFLRCFAVTAASGVTGDDDSSGVSGIFNSQPSIVVDDVWCDFAILRDVLFRIFISASIAL